LSHGLDTFDVTEKTEDRFFYTFDYDEEYTVSVCTQRPDVDISIVAADENDFLREFEKNGMT
jgi:hypothetical protein